MCKKCETPIIDKKQNEDNNISLEQTFIYINIYKVWEQTLWISAKLKS